MALWRNPVLQATLPKLDVGIVSSSGGCILGASVTHSHISAAQEAGMCGGGHDRTCAFQRQCGWTQAHLL
ncbi:hypothetical protein AAFF_G00333210 [Aldrovandia affinis]|uniref:Uncharacterized protein n=1 Tax=Aldrovandia affinis TaxID=143900 RepID=A0AAD7SLM0_9TELE|nr:hypothetical protein AAFF_G00333210 [Aldrovandia affinis]